MSLSLSLSLSLSRSILVRSCLLITVITCLKDHKSLRLLYGSVFLGVSQLVSDMVTIELSWGQLKILEGTKPSNLHWAACIHKGNIWIWVSVWQDPKSERDIFRDFFDTKFCSDWFWYFCRNKIFSRLIPGLFWYQHVFKSRKLKLKSWEWEPNQNQNFEMLFFNQFW